MALTSPPEKNCANIELITELSKRLGRQVRIIGGQTSKRKKLAIEISDEDWAAFLSSVPSA